MKQPVVTGYRLRLPKNKMTRGNVLVLQWEKHNETFYASHALRMECPCLSCKTGDTLKGVPAQIEVLSVESFGYALKILFSDNHGAGIYPLEYLLNNHHAEYFI
jgi:DUF971 family protein